MGVAQPSEVGLLDEALAWLGELEVLEPSGLHTDQALAALQQV
jgi:hypothetical protein